jgi:hypothetical protein
MQHERRDKDDHDEGNAVALDVNGNGPVQRQFVPYAVAV